jgi:hypothetical protein
MLLRCLMMVCRILTLWVLNPILFLKGLPHVMIYNSHNVVTGNY